MIHVSMSVDAKCGAAQAAAVDQTGVTETIGEDESILADQGRNDADIREVTGSKRQRSSCAFEPSEVCFQYFVRRERAADKTRGAGYGPVLTRGCDSCLYDRRVRGNPQVIVG